MNKHAYLIMAHHQFQLLEMLIRSLDFEQNDLYVHIDKKARDFDFDYFRSLPQKSNIFFVPRIDNTWGSFSGIETELHLLKAAARHNYSYFHLLSGADLPLKNAQEIYEFFEEHNGKEFVHFCTEKFTQRASVVERVSLYHLFTTKTGQTNRFYHFLDRASLALQRLLHVNRLDKDSHPLYCGSSWFSITKNFAQHLLQQEALIKSTYQKSFCADEIFLQTTLMASEFRNNLYKPCYSDDCHANMRFIDWSRGTNHPFVFRLEDFDRLMSSGCLFARKFDLNVDDKICDKIFNTIVCER